MPAPDPVLDILHDLKEDDFPTAEYDVLSLAQATEVTENEPSGIRRRSFPTISNEVGPLPNEPAEDTLYRCFGCGARVVSQVVSADALAEFHLERRHLHVLSLLDGERSLSEVLEISRLPRLDTLCALEELLILEVVD